MHFFIADTLSVAEIYLKLLVYSPTILFKLVFDIMKKMIIIIIIIILIMIIITKTMKRRLKKM